MEKSSIKTFLSWNGDIKVAGMKQCLRITASLSAGMLQRSLTRGKPNDSDLMSHRGRLEPTLLFDKDKGQSIFMRTRVRASIIRVRGAGIYGAADGRRRARTGERATYLLAALCTPGQMSRQMCVFSLTTRLRGIHVLSLPPKYELNI
ncbi:hypothetical protein EVAR_76619_1 [Eumeta japonica]|uniref:Uncharacterized protein n=1 Tax=Eumeta variegata TaxID=151549 RepID=A0A4C1T548_EUMVA|nr:hypothetical protein EVAR_76619_1 [Eumeta japonica]